MKTKKSLARRYACIAIIFSFFLGSNIPRCFAEAPVVLGAIGDSISVACNASSLGDNPTMSWSTGTDSRVNSHLKRLGVTLKTDIQGINLARTGAKVSDLASQVDLLQKNKPDFVTIEIGANDLCSWVSNDPAKIIQVGLMLREYVEKIIESNARVKILLASIPDMYGLWEIGVKKSECQLKWQLFNICTPILSPRNSPADRGSFVERWKALNSMIAAVAEYYPNHVVFNPSVANARLSEAHISSLDCFHPSISGQAYLAEKAWPYTMSLLR